MDMKALVLLCISVWATHSAVVTVTPHNGDACSSRCKAKYYPMTDNQCTPIYTNGFLSGPNKKTARISFGLTSTDGQITLSCSCNSGNNYLARWTPGNESAVNVELSYSAHTSCNIQAAVPANYSCSRVDNYPCNAAQPKALLAIDTAQMFPHCGLQSCLSYHNWTYHSGVNYCDYSQHVYSCFEATNCVTAKTHAQCKTLRVTCPDIECPTANVVVCPQTPVLPTTLPTNMIPEWDCDNNTCTLLCPAGTVPNWINGQYQEAATCNHINGQWKQHVYPSSPCKKGTCDKVVQDCALNVKHMNMNGTCNIFAAYLKCVSHYGCEPDIAKECWNEQQHCPSLDCPPRDNSCPDTPEATDYGTWNCNNTDCQVDCDDEYYVSWPRNSSQEIAAQCIAGHWAIRTNTPPCKQCRFGAWRPWGTCSRTCNGGSQISTREVFGDPDDCYPHNRTQLCNTQPCPGGNCQIGDWGAWSPCTATCGGGVRSRTRVVIGPTGCPSTVTTMSCATNACGAPTCRYSDWSEWDKCSEPCGGGIHWATRTIIQGSGCGSLKRYSVCNAAPCPCTGSGCKNCTMFAWSSWSSCTKSCGGGVATRTRTFQGQCSRYTRQQTSCNTQACGCQYASWGPWSTCSKVCGGGNQMRTRKSSGSACASTSQMQACATIPCPGSDCQVGQWGKWSKCSKSCGTGQRSRHRSIVKPPSHGGAICPAMTQTSACNTRSCQSTECRYRYGPWSGCSKSCGGGTSTRAGHLMMPKAVPQCPQQKKQSRSCNLHPCK